MILLTKLQLAKLKMVNIKPEITLKHYAHLWSGADENVAELMAGNININTAEQTKIAFNGNQSLKKNIPPKSPPKWYSDPKKPVISTN